MALVLPEEEITDRRALETWLRVFRASSNYPQAGNVFFGHFSAPGLGRHLFGRHDVPSLDGEPVGRTSLVLAAGGHSPGSDGAGGAAGALVRAALRDGREAGYRFCVLHSTAMAESLYRQLGFEEYCRLNVYLWQRQPS